jgi:hypothetical protein
MNDTCEVCGLAFLPDERQSLYGTHHDNALVCVRRLRTENERLRAEVAFDAAFAPGDTAEIIALRAANERMTTALIDIADGGDFVPLSDIGRRMDIDTAKRALGIAP